MTDKPTPEQIIEWLNVRIHQYGSDADLQIIPAGVRHRLSRDTLISIRDYIAATSADKPRQSLRERMEEAEGHTMMLPAKESDKPEEICGFQHGPNQLKSDKASAGDVPTGAIHNGHACIERIQNNYKFDDGQGNGIEHCFEWQELKECFNHLAQQALQADRQHTIPEGWQLVPKEGLGKIAVSVSYGYNISGEAVLTIFRDMLGAIKDGIPLPQAERQKDAQTWRPISEAPKDGTRIIIDGVGFPVIAQWVESAPVDLIHSGPKSYTGWAHSLRYWTDFKGGVSKIHSYAPTGGKYWMHIPAAPGGRG